ncbi:snapalysin family zinc-dependent metalloprotease [Spirillospora sp. NPDC047279]|uniref:snapalysin family zinc-dependent metalloprotease n=1 Tax=Spirillospora sp. NPDC047279 TaxID=3155478 RepID=UPI00340E306E
MLRRQGVRALIGATAVTLTLTIAPAANSAAALATTLYYDDSQAAEFKSAVAAGAQAWNSSVTNVRITKAPAGRRAEIVVIADNGWPRANLGPVRPGGRVTIWFGRQAVQQGYNPTRIASHEMGHSLGLPDRKPGPCSSLMSGSTGGVSCTNALPNATERAGVDRNYAGTTVPATRTGSVLVDAP